MTVKDVPFMNASAGQPDYSAVDMRLHQSAILGHTGSSRLLGARSGVVPGLVTALQATHNGATPGVVTVAVGQAFIDGTLTQGNYLVTVEVAEQFNVPAAGSVTRTDRVWVRARDAEVDGTVGTNRNGVVEYGQGDTGTGNPPAVPSHALLLCEVTVPVAGTPSVTDKRTYIARTDSIGTPVADSTEQAAITTPYEGQCIYRRSDDAVLVYDGSAWRSITTGPPPYARIHRASNQTISHDTLTQVNFGTLDEESVSTFGDTANNRLVVPQAGLYLIVLNITWDITDADGYRAAQINVGGNVIRRDRFWANGTGFDGYNWISVTYRLSASDQITAHVHQTSGSSQAVKGGTGDLATDSGLSALWVRA